MKNPQMTYVSPHNLSYLNLLILFFNRLKRDSQNGVKQGIAQLSLWKSRMDQRHALKSLDPWHLKDVGISLSDAQHEGDKPFWKA